MKKLLLIIAVVSFFVSCQQGQTKDPKAQLDQLKKQQKEIGEEIRKLETQIAASDTAGVTEKPKLVAVSALQPSLFEHFIEVQGRVEADQNVGVMAQLPGTITNILVSKGQRVRKGQVLATMDAATSMAGIEALKKNLELANLLYEKQKSLWDQSIGTEVQYLQSKNQKESLEKQLNVLQQQYELSKIKSPINGTVDEVMAKLGEAASPGYPSFRVVNLSSMKVVADIAENYAGTIKVGDEVTITFPDANKEVIKKVTAISQVIDQASRSFQVDIRLGSDEQKYFHPNMVAVLKIRDYSKDNSISVPINIVQNSEEGKFVFLAKQAGNKMVAEKAVITAGSSYGDRIEVLSGLNPGDELITTGYQDLGNGQPLIIDNSQASVKQ
ncbi:MAG: efflux RND transporter periplasmic adaptor subunit [Chitinophagales bacterium]|nr:efflux RND transporter periplasmic adaptor subunit [Chitinophagales bacterium]